ncbi:MAG: aspartate--tRNA ligase [Candidatus Wildermuthbacteria bacterium]|nr:aspartate--tRNA ligase [Candidatus Wildermuthbacteria bacterium]
MERILTAQTPAKKGETVKVAGWIANRRDHGKIIFLDLRDSTGTLQMVITPEQKETYEKAKDIRSEWVVQAEGKVQERPEGMKNQEIETGSVELSIENIEIFSKAETPPFPIDTQGYEVGEEARLQYRYLDLRRARLKKNLLLRHQVLQFMRNFLSKEGFVEIETPMLTKSTPEGARDFVVPSRLYPGTFYALPQSPQQYKQLLQVAGFERYFQIARCFRDEDPRADRQPEFTQLDLEMSFVEREDVMELTERLLIDIVKTLYPEKKIQDIPFPRVSYKDAVKQHGNDRPDLRKNKEDQNLLAFCWIVDFPFFEKDEKGAWTFTHNPFSSPKREYMQNLMAKKNIGEIIATQYDIVLNGVEIGGGSIRNHNPEALEKVFEIMGYTPEQIQANFGHMLKAFSYGAPPHGGIAWGFDRLISLLQLEPNIREVIAFPKTGDSRDLLMQSPSELAETQLKELHLQFQKRKK